jgi:protoheme IX farnesyltransferase
VNATTGLLAAIAFLSYAFVYTPLKRHSAYALHVGAVPGAMPPLIGWACMSENLSLGAFSLFFVLFVWQIPHFLAIALFRSDDYRRAGLQVYPNVYGAERTHRAMAVWSVILLCAALLPAFLGLAGALYAVIATVSGVAFLGLVTAGRRFLEPRKWARTVFFASMPYLVFVFAALALSAS